MIDNCSVFCYYPTKGVDFMANCGGNCASCGGCARELTLTEMEVDFLLKFAQIPFLPVARRMDNMEHQYLESDAPENCSLILQCLEKKGLLSMDYDMPLKGFDYSAYAAFPVRGSMVLTERGHTVLDLLERQGLS